MNEGERLANEVRRHDFAVLVEIQTRWADNDVYGHINNVAYYSYFDTAVNRHLIERGVLNYRVDAVVGYVVESRCSYLRPIAFPCDLAVGLRVAQLGRSSVSYDLALFDKDAETPAAVCRFVHVYVDKVSGRAASIPIAARSVIEELLQVNR